MTATRAALLELATRCEQASGPDRDLDADVQSAVRSDMAGPWGRMHAPAVTASLSAAMTLVRSVKCFVVALGDLSADGLPGCCLCVNTDPVREVWGIATGGGGDPDGKLARATVSAALRALAAEAPQ